MNQSELIEKVAQATELNQAVAGQAVKVVANAILDALVAGEEVRVSGLGIFKVAARPAREGRNPQTGEAIQIAASKAVRFHTGKAVKDALNPPTPLSIGRGKPRPVFASRAPDADVSDYTSQRTRQGCAFVRFHWPLGVGRPIRASQSTTSARRRCCHGSARVRPC